MRISILITSLAFFCSIVYAQKEDSIASQKLNEVEISAALKPSTALSSTPLQVLTAKELQTRGILSVADALKQFNGIVLKDYGGIGGLKTVSIRGMGAEYSTISYDGLIINNLQSGQVDIGRFSLDNVSMLSLSIGQDDNIFQSAKAFSSAGVLNMQTKRPVFQGKNNTVYTKVTTGSFGHFEPMIDYAHKVANKVAVSANLNWQRADGMYPFALKNSDLKSERKRENSDTDILRSEINLFTQPSDKDFLDVKFYYYDSERGLPKAIVHSTDDLQRERLWDKNGFAQIAYKRLFSEKINFKSQAKYDYNYSKYRGDIRDDKSINKYRSDELYWSNSALCNITTPLSISLAQDLSYSHLDTKFGRNQPSPPQPQRFGSFTALAAQYRTDRLTITTSALGTYINEKTKGNNKDTDFKKLAPSVSASIKPLNSTNLRLRASYKYVYRIPTFNELYYAANVRSLKAENSKQYNAGATWMGQIEDTPFRYINISADAYYNDVDDKIVIVPTLFQPTAYNVGKVIMKGADMRLTTNIQILQNISIELASTYNHIIAFDSEKKDRDGNPNPTYKKQLVYTPRNSGSTSFTIHNPWVNITYSLLWSGLRYSGGENKQSQKVDAYSDHSISLFKELVINNITLYTNTNLNNFLNKNYSIVNGYPMPGRSFKIVVGCRF